ncbi:MAG TPA: TonB C-terminal domain-containing protein [Longimicrobiales bacterium]|nr:TonB C-terminal domain-containing protein [Longimicrobiales bacterium]
MKPARGDGRKDRVPYVGSAGIHAVAIALALWTTAAEPPPLTNPLTFQIDIVSPPPTTPEPAEEPPAPEEDLVVEQPEPELPEPEEPPPVVEEKPKPKEVETPPPETKPTPPPETEPAEKKPAADSAGERVSGEDLQVRMEGLQRDYPRYYENIIRQINRCFRWQGRSGWEAQLYFVIHRDGTVSDLDIRRESGNIRFDVAASEAVGDCAGRGRFGPLPEDFAWDQLPVLFTFRPRG